MDYNEVILQAIDIVTTNRLAALRYDRTVEAEITSIVNLDTGEYKVRFEGNIVSAFADPESKYSVGEQVYVIIPEGDLSNRKIISASISKNSLSYRELTSFMNTIKEVSPSLDLYYNYNATKEYGLIAGTESIVEIYQAPDDQYHGAFQQYMQEFDLLKIEASFRTTLQDLHTKGNYGLLLTFSSSEDGNDVSYVLDLNSFTGDPYRYYNASPQQIVVQLPKNQLVGLKSIYFFETGFDYDVTPELFTVNKIDNGTDESYYTYYTGSVMIYSDSREALNDLSEDDQGSIVRKQNKTIPNLFVSDINVCFVERKDLTDTSYYLTIATPKGNSITSSIDSIDLVARIIYQGEDVLTERNSTCKWYARDLTVLSGSEDYDKEAGVGWRAVESNSANSLSLVASDIGHDRWYKLIVTYNNSTVLTDEIRVYNQLLSEAYDYKIVQETTADNITLQVVNQITNNPLVADWYILYPDGSYQRIDDFQQTSAAIEVKRFLLYDTVTFYCVVYAGTTVLGTLEHTIQSSESESALSVEYNGEDTFRYDANGDVSLEDWQLERNLEIKVRWADGVGDNYRVAWFTVDALTKQPLEKIPSSRDDAITPDNSMLQRLWVDERGILHYYIKQKYRFTYNNNSIMLRIATIKGQIYDFVKDLLFLKDGDQGTNGTTYIAVVRPYGSGYQPLTYKHGAWSSLPLKCYVYKDGERIDSNPDDFSITYNWAASQLSLVGSGDRRNATGIAPIDDSTLGENLQFYVKVQITIDDKVSSRHVVLYVAQPIDVVVGDLDISQIEIDSLPTSIQYTPSGLNPQFYSNNIWINYAGVERKIVALNPHVLQTEVRTDGLTYIKPTSSFIFEKDHNATGEGSIGVLKGVIDESRFIIHPVMMYLNTYGNEAINGWDGTSVEIDEGAYVFAPQVGAGQKEEDNTFTGVVMGKDSGQSKIGLYGYQRGATTFAFMENGTGFLGAQAGGGRIWMDGMSAVIAGGEDVAFNNLGSINTYPYGVKDGMILTLANKANRLHDYAIQIGENVFTADYNGRITAREAQINGVLIAGDGSRIGATIKLDKKTNTWKVDEKTGWIVEKDKMYGGAVTLYRGTDDDYNVQASIINAIVEQSDDVYIYRYERYDEEKEETVQESIIEDSKEAVIAKMKELGILQPLDDYYRIWAGSDNTRPSFAPFSVTNSGKVRMTNANIFGSIYAQDGRLGCTIRNNGDGTYTYRDGWIIEKDRIYSADNEDKTSHVELNSASYSSDNGVEVQGRNSNSKDYTSQSARILAGPRKEPVFYVTDKGYLRATNADITGKIVIGQIEGSKIGTLDVDENGINSADSGVSLNDNGLKSGIILLADGTLTNQDITLDENGLSSNGMTLKDGVLSEGTITQGESFSIVSGLLTSRNLTLQNGSLVSKDSNGNPITLENGSFFTAPDGSDIQVKITGTGLVAKQYTRSGNSKVEIDETNGIVIWNKAISYDSSGNQTISSTLETVLEANNQGDLNLKGYITATGGSLGNWNINRKQNSRLESTISAGMYSDSNVPIAARNRTIYLDGNPLSDNVIYIENSETITTDDLTQTTTKGRFFVTKDGHMQADGATISGAITSTKGTIGNWDIGENYLRSSSNGSAHVELNSSIKSTGNHRVTFPTHDTEENARLWAGGATAASADFYVTAAGRMYAAEAYLVGNITAKKGFIGGDTGWEIDTNKIFGKKSTSYMVISNSGSYAIYAGATSADDNGQENASNSAYNAPFSVKFDGSLKATKADISGKLIASSGEIGNWKINSSDDGALRSMLNETGASTNIFLNGSPTRTTRDPDPKIISVTSSQTITDDKDQTSYTYGQFYVTANGKLYAKSAEISGKIQSRQGKIGTWYIDSNSLSNINPDDAKTRSNTIGMSAIDKHHGCIESGTGTTKTYSTYISSIAFWAGMRYDATGYTVDGNNAKLVGSSSGSFFAVTSNGKLYCRSADMAGSLSVTGALSAGGTSEDPTFKVTSSGAVTINGDLTIGATAVNQIASVEIKGGSIKTQLSQINQDYGTLNTSYSKLTQSVSSIATAIGKSSVDDEGNYSFSETNFIQGSGVIQAIMQEVNQNEVSENSIKQALTINKYGFEFKTSGTSGGGTVTINNGTLTAPKIEGGTITGNISINSGTFNVAAGTGESNRWGIVFGGLGRISRLNADTTAIVISNPGGLSVHGGPFILGDSMYQYGSQAQRENLRATLGYAIPVGTVFFQYAT